MKKLLIIFALFISPPAFALEITGGDYQGREDVAVFVQRIAEGTSYDERELVDLFSQVEKQEHLFDKLNRPAEKELE